MNSRDSATSVWREGLVTGLLGAGGVAVWFLGVDVLAGEPFRTPRVLGDALLALIGASVPAWTSVAFYTVVHVAAFVTVGLIACKLVEISRRVPHVTVGLLLLFVVFEVGFHFVAMFLAGGDVIGTLSWYQIGAANLVAAVLMGGYIWRHHPELKSEIQLALDGRI
jgi:hypothetical protein